MPKVLLKQHQFVDHVYYRVGENEVSDEVAAILKERGALADEVNAPATKTKTANKPQADEVNN